MDLEDLEPKKKKAYELGQDLSKLSVGELAELVETLKAEIARVGSYAHGKTIVAERCGCGLQALTILANSLSLGKSDLSVNSPLGGLG
jgi:uncharacterized small protein (DUF1192 family)